MVGLIVAFAFVVAIVLVFKYGPRAAPAGHEDYHPTDADGNYVRAGDNVLRIGRGNVMLVSDDTIAWHGKGDIINTRDGFREVTYVDCMGCFYEYRNADGAVDRITFSDASRLNANS